SGLRARRPCAGRPAAASICSLLMRGACRLAGRPGGSVPVARLEAGGSLAGKVASKDLSTFFCLASSMSHGLHAPALHARALHARALHAGVSTPGPSTLRIVRHAMLGTLF